MIYMTANTAYTIGGVALRGLFIQVNAALTGTLTVKDDSTTKAVITNPAVGNQFVYYGFTGVCTVTPSTTCDATASALSVHG